MSGEHLAESGEDRGSTRREFVKATVVGAVGLTVGYKPSSTDATGGKAPPPAPHNPRTYDAMPTRNLGNTRYRKGDVTGKRTERGRRVLMMPVSDDALKDWTQPPCAPKTDSSCQPGCVVGAVLALSAPFELPWRVAPEMGRKGGTEKGT